MKNASKRNQVQLIMPCCEARAIPKTSPHGIFFFAHYRRGGCDSAPESQEHLLFKSIVARAAKAAGWNVTTERQGTSKTGETWIADVFCGKGNAKVAFEIQLSKITKEEIHRRQTRYTQSNVRCAWFADLKKFENVRINSKDIPFFLIYQTAQGRTPIVDKFDITLSQFVKGMLEKKLRWVEKPYIYSIRYVDDMCWKCLYPIKLVCGYAIDWFEEVAKTVPNASNILREMVKEIITNAELRALGLCTVGKAEKLKGNAPKFPYCNHCPHCGAPQNNFYLMKKIKEMKSIPFTSPREASGKWVFEGLP